MGKSKGSNSGSQPNAPELQQILLESASSQQPPLNPYYPDLSTNSHLFPPPPYATQPTISSSNHHPMTRFNSGDSNYPRSTMPTHAPTVIVQRPISHYDRSLAKYHRKIRKFNYEMLVVALVTIVSSVYALGLYNSRHCIDNFLVHQINKDVSVRISDVRDMHVNVMYGGIFLLILCLAKCAGGESRSYSCYLFFVGLYTLIGTIYTGYLAYLAFYSPCSLKPGELASNTVKTLFGYWADKMPSPDKGVFNESNVLQLAREDKQGFFIFIIDLFNFILYLSGFLSSIL